MIDTDLLVTTTSVKIITLELNNLWIYQARAERGLFTNKEDTIPGPSDSIGAPKMYILEKGIFGTQVSILGFWKI